MSNSGTATGAGRVYIGVCFFEEQQTTVGREGGAVAEWSKALLKREKINENQEIPGLGNI